MAKYLTNVVAAISRTASVVSNTVLFGVAMLAFATSDAGATTITFDNIGLLYTQTSGYTFSDSGYQFTFNALLPPVGFQGTGQVTGIFPTGPTFCSPQCSSDGTRAYYSGNAASLTMSAMDGSSFSLLSIDAAQYFTTQNRSLDLAVIGQLQGGGTITEILTTLPGGADTFSTYSLPAGFSDLTSVEFVGAEKTWPNEEFALDNIVVQTAVPEPTTWVIFILGFGVLGFVMRNRKSEALSA